MKTISTDRIDSSITVYKDRIILPMEVEIACGACSDTLIAYTATIIDVADITLITATSLDDYYRTIDGAIAVAKLAVDLAIISCEARI